MKSLKTAIALALLATGLNCARAQSWLTNNLVAHYLFNGTGADTSGNSHNGVIQYGAYYGTNRFGIAGKSLVFNGTNSSFVATNFPLINSNFTYSAWLKISGLNSTGDYDDLQTFGCLGAYPGVTWNFTFDESHGGFNLWDDSNQTWYTDGGDFTAASNWVQAVISYNQTNGTEWLYLNGNPVASRGVSLPIPDGGDRRFFVGAYDITEGQPFKGQIDDVRLYNVTLSSNQVSQLYGVEAYATAAALGTAALDHGFLVYVNLTYGGTGYTNVPTVQFIGGGGSGAQAVAVVSNGVVTAINVLDAGYGYTNAPLVVIGPPYVTTPVLAIAPATLLTFSNLVTGTNYQLQVLVTNYWTNQQSAFTATGSVFTQSVTGLPGGANYRLVPSPVPATATATATVVNGFMVNATLTGGGSGYVTNPAVHITGGNGSGALAQARISAAGVVTNLTVTSAGSGYTGTPAVSIAAPPVTAISPAATPQIQLNSSSLIPYVSYQLQAAPALGGIWTTWTGGSFSPTGTVNSQFLSVTNQAGWFRLQAD